MDFQKEVLEKSQEHPIVVDFWAPWCGPCQFLGPIIEELADNAAGKWELVKVNTDDNPDLMIQYGVRGIPAVKMFHKGEILAEFSGALPKYQIEKWLEEYLPDKRKELLDSFRERITEDGVSGEIESFVDENPDLTEGRILLARSIIFSDPKRARELVSQINMGEKHFEQAQDVASIVDLLTCELSDKSTISKKIGEARKAIQTDTEKALQTLIEAVALDRKYCEEIARKATIALFNLLGPQHELTLKYRRKFDMSLY